MDSEINNALEVGNIVSVAATEYSLENDTELMSQIENLKAALFDLETRTKTPLTQLWCGCEEEIYRNPRSSLFPMMISHALREFLDALFMEFDSEIEDDFLTDAHSQNPLSKEAIKALKSNPVIKDRIILVDNQNFRWKGIMSLYEKDQLLGINGGDQAWSAVVYNDLWNNCGMEGKRFIGGEHGASKTYVRAKGFFKEYDPLYKYNDESIRLIAKRNRELYEKLSHLAHFHKSRYPTGISVNEVELRDIISGVIEFTLNLSLSPIEQRERIDKILNG